MKCFSFKHLLHLFVVGEWNLLSSVNFHFMLNLIFFLFRVQMYWLSVVAFFVLLVLKRDVSLASCFEGLVS